MSNNIDISDIPDISDISDSESDIDNSSRSYYVPEAQDFIPKTGLDYSNNSYTSYDKYGNANFDSPDLLMKPLNDSINLDDVSIRKILLSLNTKVAKLEGKVAVLESKSSGGKRLKKTKRRKYSNHKKRKSLKK